MPIEVDLKGIAQLDQSTEGFPLGLEQEEPEAEGEGAIRGEQAAELILVQVHQMDPTKTTKIGALLHKEAQESFKGFL